MEIRFDPDSERDVHRVELLLMTMRSNKMIGASILPDAVATRVEQVLAAADNPETGVPVPPSAVPFPPVPASSTAAADLFPTAPAVPSAGIPLPPGAELPPVPIVPAAPPVPTAPAVPASPAAGVELDAAGLPWDARIHSESRARIKDGTWRQKRGTAPELVAQVEAELRALMAIPTPAAAVPTAPPAPISVMPAGPGATAIVIDPSAAVPPAPATASPASVPMPPVPAPPVPLPPAAAPTPVAPPPVAQATETAPAETVTFAQLMKYITEGLKDRKFAQADVDAALAHAGNGTPIAIGAMAARLDLAQVFYQFLKTRAAP